MNKRIQQLAEQCTSFHTDYDFEHGYSDVEYFDKEKFAELIVQECVRKVRNRGGMCGALASSWIEEHFYGVEE